MLVVDQAALEVATETATIIGGKLIDVVIDSARQHPAVFLVGATVVATSAVVMTQVKSITWGSFNLQTK